MRALIAIIRETFLRLRRDKIFAPAIIAGLSLLALSGVVSYWGTEEFYKILYDLGTASFNLTGAIVSIFWGNKIISDSRQEGSLEVQLASPVSRSSWLIGKFIGLSLALSLVAIIFIAGWQGIYTYYGMGWILGKDLIIFAFLTLGWLVMGAVSIFFASFASTGIALFCTAWMFLLGLMTGPISQALAPDTPAVTKRIVEVISVIWNLHLFNLSSAYAQDELLSQANLLARLTYGILIIGLTMTSACTIFKKRDLIAL